MTRPLRVAFVGTYDRAPHGRNAIVIEALRSVGVEVVERHVPLWAGTDDKVAAAGGSAAHLAAVGRRVLRAWRALNEVTADLGGVDVVWVGATGLVDLPIARRVADRLGAPLVFDPLVSLGETVRDRGLAAGGGMRLFAYERIERRLFALADQVVVDTTAHAEAWADDLALPRAKALVVPVGAPRVFHDAAPDYAPRSDRPLSVVYFGQFIPLHGVEVMLQAAARLREAPIDFTFVGVGQTLEAAERLAGDLGLARVRFVPAWLSPAALIETHIAGADVCLGVFGDRPKTARVVPYKVYAALAAGRPVVTGDTAALRERLTPGHDVVAVPCGDPDALAQALAELARSPGARARLAAAGRETWEASFSPERLGTSLRAALWETVAMHAAERRGIGPRQRWRARHLAGLVRVAASSTPAVDRGLAPVVLDVGCGDGAMSMALGRGDGDDAPPTILAFDVDLARVRAARGRMRRLVDSSALHAFVADATAIPLADASVQAAVSGEVLEHVADDAAAAREIARVLVAGGALAVTVPAGAARYGAADRAAGHVRRYEAATLERLLSGAGFAVERLAPWGFPFGRGYDRWVQGPGLAVLRGGEAGAAAVTSAGLRSRFAPGQTARLLRSAAANRGVHRALCWLFDLDDWVLKCFPLRVRSDSLGSGLDAVGRKGDKVAKEEAVS
ncbi:MAG: glycosyltransferase [Ardenticatenales bacterium]